MCTHALEIEACERNVFSGSATRTQLQVELKGAPKPFSMTPVVGKVSHGQSTGMGLKKRKTRGP